MAQSVIVVTQEEIIGDSSGRVAHIIDRYDLVLVSNPPTVGETHVPLASTLDSTVAGQLTQAISDWLEAGNTFS